jgi:glucokinase
MMGYYVGIDLGATNIRVVVASDDASVIESGGVSTPQGPSGIAVTEAVLRVTRNTCQAASISPDQVSAAGIGAIGPLNLTSGSVEDPANLPNTINEIPLTGPLSVLFDTERVFLHNDTNAGAIGERFHADTNPDDMAYLTISSGIGAGVCVDGSVIDGWDGNAGEVGHMTVDPRGKLTCGCGHDGHWEAYCSGNNIPHYARALADEQTIETDLPLSDPDFSAKDVFLRADEDRLAAHIVEQLGRWNAIGVANLIHAYAPLVIYVGGAVALNNPTAVLDPIRAHIDDMVMSNVPEIKLTTLGDDVVVMGAVASALTGGTGDHSHLRMD